MSSCAPGSLAPTSLMVIVKDERFTGREDSVVRERLLRHGKCFAVDAGSIITAAHLVSGGFVGLEVNGVVVRYGDVEVIGSDVVRIDVPNHGLGLLGVGRGSRGDRCEIGGLEGIVLSECATSVLIREGMSGSPVLVGGRVVGVASSIMPELGISTFGGF